MSRWLWALLGGVVLVAIAALFWTAGNWTNVTLPVSPGPATVTPGPTVLRPSPKNPRPHRAPRLQRSKPRPRLHPHLRPRPRGRPRPRQLLPLRPCRPLLLLRSMRGSKPPRCQLQRLPPRSPPLRRSPRGSHDLRLLPPGPPKRLCRRQPSNGRRRSPGSLRAQEPRATGRGMGLFRGGLRQDFPAERQRVGLPAAGGQVRPGRNRRVDEEDPSAFRQLPDRERV